VSLKRNFLIDIINDEQTYIRECVLNLYIDSFVDIFLKNENICVNLTKEYTVSADSNTKIKHMTEGYRFKDLLLIKRTQDIVIDYFEKLSNRQKYELSSNSVSFCKLILLTCSLMCNISEMSLL